MFGNHMAEWIKKNLPKEEDTRLTTKEKITFFLIGAVGAFFGTNPDLLKIF